MDAQRRIEHEYRVRFDEADGDSRLRPSGLLRYAQDMAWRHSEEAGFDRQWYRDRSMNWLVRNVKVSVFAPATYGDVLAVSTEVIGWRRVWARRRSEIRRRPSGREARERLVAAVETDWVLLTQEGQPARVPPEVAGYFSTREQFTRERVELPLPAGDVTSLSTRVRPLDVDPMRHMNNAAYVDMVDDALERMPGAHRPTGVDTYRIGYVAPALPGTLLRIDCWRASDVQVACRISDADGNELTKALVSRSGD